MVGTGLRVGEVTGLRWCDIDLEEGLVDVNHTLVYYDHRETEGNKGCYINVNTPKTKAGTRQVPMLDFVRDAFIQEREHSTTLNIYADVTKVLKKDEFAGLDLYFKKSPRQNITSPAL